MNRRQFLGLLGLGAGAVALEQAIPLNRVWSFPKNIVVVPPGAFRLNPGDSIRFVKAWDSASGKMMCRFDVLYGFGNLAQLPAVEGIDVLQNRNEKPMTVVAADRFPQVPSIAVDRLSDAIKQSRDLMRLGPRGLGVFVDCPEI